MKLKAIRGIEEGKEYKEIVEKNLREKLKSRYLKFLSSASAAIHLIYKIFDRIAIQDQGIWKGYFDIAKYYDVELIKLKTNLGIIDTEYLKEFLEKNKPRALIIQSISGYIANQDVKEIYEICKKYGTILINDISGSIFLKGLSDCTVSDILICSTGKPKVINIGFGGFIATNLNLEEYNKFLYAFKVPNIYYKYLYEELKISEKRIHLLTKYSRIFKEEIESCIHRDRIGICIGILRKNPKEILKGINFRLDDGSSLVTICPNINRFLDEGFTLELKKIDVLSIDEELIYNLLNKLKFII